MAVEAALVTLLTTDATVAALIGTRIAPVGQPQGVARPNVIYQRIGTKRDYHNEGSTGLPSARIQVGCYADTYKTARQLAGAVRAVLDGYRGTVGGQEIAGVWLDDERDAPQPPADGKGAGVQGVQFDAVIAYRE